jgi:hypothetical protein
MEEERKWSELRINQNFGAGARTAVSHVRVFMDMKEVVVTYFMV